MGSSRRVRKKGTIAFGTSIGAVVCIITSFAFAAILTTLALNESLRDEGLLYATPCIVLISSFLGSFAAGKIVDEKKFLACICTLSVYVFVLIGMTILFFEGKFQSIILGISMVLVGGGVSLLLNIKGKKPTIKKVSSRRIR